MNLSKRQKMLLAVLGAAVGAFMIDAMLPGPSAASAGVQPDVGLDLSGATPPPPGTGSASMVNNAGHEALMRVVDRLRSVEPGDGEDETHLPDPFAARKPSVLKIAQDAVILTDADTTVQIPRATPAIPERVPPTIRISSIMNAPEGRFALIDGQLRREGDRLGDWVITRIAERSIRLSDGTQEVRVPMDR